MLAFQISALFALNWPSIKSARPPWSGTRLYRQPLAQLMADLQVFGWSLNVSARMFTGLFVLARRRKFISKLITKQLLGLPAPAVR